MKTLPSPLRGAPHQRQRRNRDCYPMCRQPVQRLAPTAHTRQSYHTWPEFPFLHLYTVSFFFFFPTWLISNLAHFFPILAALSGISRKMRTRKGQPTWENKDEKGGEEGTKQDQAEVKPRRTLAAAWRRKKRCSPTFLKTGWRVRSEGIMQARRKLQKY